MTSFLKKAAHLGARLRAPYTRARRLAIVGAVIGWSGAALFIALGPTNRSIFGPMKWADFPHFYTLAHVSRLRAGDLLYDVVRLDALQHALVPESGEDHFLPVYAPQTALLFAPFAALPYFAAGALWALITIVIYIGCVWLAWRPAHGAFADRTFVVAAALAFPPAWQLAVYGQTTAVPLLSFTAAWLALEARRPLLAGLALSLLTIKPQFALVITAIAMASLDWRMMLGAALGIVAQAIGVAMVFGASVFHAYADVVMRMPALSPFLEPKAWELHSLRALTQLLPRRADWMVWSGLSVVVTALTFRVWRSDAPLRLRFGTVVLASLLVDPHLETYDVAVLALPVAWIGGLFLERGVNVPSFWQLVFWLGVTLLAPTARWIPVQASAVLLAALFARTAGMQWPQPASPKSTAAAGHP